MARSQEAAAGASLGSLGAVFAPASEKVMGSQVERLNFPAGKPASSETMMTEKSWESSTS